MDENGLRSAIQFIGLLLVIALAAVCWRLVFIGLWEAGPPALVLSVGALAIMAQRRNRKRR